MKKNCRFLSCFVSQNLINEKINSLSFRRDEKMTLAETKNVTTTALASWIFGKPTEARKFGDRDPFPKIFCELKIQLKNPNRPNRKKYPF